MNKTIMAVMIIAIFFSQCVSNRAPLSTALPGNMESFVSCMARGMQNLEQKKYDEAISALKRASLLKPDAEKAFNFLGIAYLMKKNFAEALPCFQEALRINPAYVAAICNLGNLQFEMGEVDTAVTTLRKAIASYPDDVGMHFSLGNILLHQGEFDEGFAHLKIVLELDPAFLEREKYFSLKTSSGDLSRSELYFRYACLYAAAGNLEKTLEYLDSAEKTGFVEWDRIRHDSAFARFRDDPQVKKYFE